MLNGKKQRANYGKRKQTMRKISWKILEAKVAKRNSGEQQKGTSAWLNPLSIKEEGCSLTKREFLDAILSRYRLPIKRLPTNCDCR